MLKQKYKLLYKIELTHTHTETCSLFFF